MKVKVHRGTDQIGGCVTEITSKNARIIIDMGEQLPGADIKTDLEIEGVTAGKVDCDGVFITHYHGDHIGMYHKVLEGIPIYIGAAAKEIYSALSLRVQRYHPERLESIERSRTYEIAKPIVIKDMKVTPFFVDHSAYDAYMLLVECEGQRILHTGDFRMHGYTGKGVLPTLEKYVGKVDVLITEGTMLSREGTPRSEADLQRDASRILRDNKFVFLLCSSTNIDRIATFYNALPRGNHLLCDAYQKEVLDTVKNYGGKRTSFYDFKDEKLKVMGRDKFDCKAGFCMLIRSNEFSKKKIEKYAKIPGSILVYSMWDGYLHGKHRNENISELAEMMEYIPLHTSGHVSRADLKLVIDTVNPKYVIPIHTENARGIGELCGDGMAKFLKDGESLLI